MRRLVVLLVVGLAACGAHTTQPSDQQIQHEQQIKDQQVQADNAAASARAAAAARAQANAKLERLAYCQQEWQHTITFGTDNNYDKLHADSDYNTDHLGQLYACTTGVGP